MKSPLKRKVAGASDDQTISTTVKPKSGRKVHKCDWHDPDGKMCGKIYTKSSHLKAHFRYHTGNYTDYYKLLDNAIQT